MRRLLLLLVAFGGSGCLETSTSAPAAAGCSCPADQRCDESGACVALPTACASDGDCPAGQACGVVEPGTTCASVPCPLSPQCRAVEADALEGARYCERDDACRSGRCDGGACVQPCGLRTCADGFACAARVLTDGWTLAACSPLDDDDGLTLCRSDLDCAADRRCELLRPFDEGDGDRPPVAPPFVCRVGARETIERSCGGGADCDRGLCTFECRGGPMSPCSLRRCASPCHSAEECAPGLVCRALIEGDADATHPSCALSPSDGCFGDSYCCELVDGACQPADSVCAVVLEGDAPVFRCRAAEARALLGEPCTEQLPCASGLCLDGKCAGPADPSGLRACEGAGRRVATLEGGGPLPFGLLAACVYPRPRSPCSHDGDCCWFVKELQRCPRDGDAPRCVLDPVASGFLCDVPTGAADYGEPCAEDATCASGLCLDDRCGGAAREDGGRCPLPGIRTTLDASGGPLPHGLAAACSFAPSCWFGAETARADQVRSCLRAPAEVTISADIDVRDAADPGAWVTGHELCARLGQGPCREIVDFGCGVVDCDRTVEPARAVRCDCIPP